MTQRDRLVKMLIIGDSGVGKSCLLLRFCDDSFTPSFISTIGIDFKIKKVEVDGQSTKLQIWDTAGQERFRTITTAYYRGAMGIIVVYDVTSERSFRNVENWMNNIKLHTSQDAVVFLVGNKCDMDGEREVMPEMGKKKAAQYGVSFREASAKTSENVDSVFIEVTREIQLRMVEAEPTQETRLEDKKDTDTGWSCC